MLEFSAVRKFVPSLVDNLNRVRGRIERAAGRSGRAAGDVTLIAVSKTRSAGEIRELHQAGVRHFGENRVQEFESKLVALGDLDATWHLIGHLQGNKVLKAARLFDCIDSVDSAEILARLERAWSDPASVQNPGITDDLLNARRHPLQRILIEVKLDPAASKSGVVPSEVMSLADIALSLPHLELCGLMGVPPYFDDVEKTRPYFRQLREIRDLLCSRLGKEPTGALSMGMSHDFEVAIEEGATEIRVGTALFGKRVIA